jgi:TIR domain
VTVKERKPKSNTAPVSVSPAQANKRVVFLNHANPEDNVFVLWLGARLTAAGYHVWSDLLQLVGGERFWNDINEAIRQHTAVFLPILSKASIDPAKEGVHNEIAIATAVRRELKLDNFVVPVRMERAFLKFLLNSSSSTTSISRRTGRTASFMFWRGSRDPTYRSSLRRKWRQCTPGRRAMPDFRALSSISQKLFRATGFQSGISPRT